jgi:hypothetical protein
MGSSFSRETTISLYGLKGTKRKGEFYMNLVLHHEGFESYLVEKRPLDGGVQYVFRFENNYGASVVKTHYSYGHNANMWELAVIEFYEGSDEWGLTYSTPISDDVEGYLTDGDVQNLLAKIKEL